MQSLCTNCQIGQGRYCECRRQQDEADGKMTGAEVLGVFAFLSIGVVALVAAVGFAGRWIG
ncbi:MAG: hypothetical protein ACRCV9_02150 [Burkholderiaceae bacterium]